MTQPRKAESENVRRIKSGMTFDTLSACSGVVYSQIRASLYIPHPLEPNINNTKNLRELGYFKSIN